MAYDLLKLYFLFLLDICCPVFMRLHVQCKCRVVTNFTIKGTVLEGKNVFYSEKCGCCWQFLIKMCMYEPYLTKQSVNGAILPSLKARPHAFFFPAYSLFHSMPPCPPIFLPLYPSLILSSSALSVISSGSLLSTV